MIPSLSGLKRPKLLVQAARAGLRDYRRSIHLRKILGSEALPEPGAALSTLVRYEAELNDARLSQMNYNPRSHVMVLVAMLDEVQRQSRIEATN